MLRAKSENLAFLGLRKLRDHRNPIIGIPLRQIRKLRPDVLLKLT